MGYCRFNGKQAVYNSPSNSIMRSYQLMVQLAGTDEIIETTWSARNYKQASFLFKAYSIKWPMHSYFLRVVD